MNKGLIQGFCAMAIAALLAACSTPLEAVMDFDNRYDFTGARKIAIQPVTRANANAIMISDMDVSRINQALTDELGRKGFQVVKDNAQADLWLTWHLVTQEKTDVRTYNSMSSYNCWRCGPSVSDVSVRQFTEGTFIVDMIDPSRNQSVWRATIQSRMKSKPDAETDAAVRLEAAAAIFTQFPPY
jgi:hypothetical protein